MKRFSRPTFCLLLSAVILSIVSVGCGHPPATQQSPPVVEFATVIEQDVPIYGNWIATLQGYVNAQIEPHVSGYLIQQNYREGSFVHKGDVLFKIDPRPFQAALDQAKAQAAQAQAQLGAAEINVKRDIPEAKAHAIPQSQLDNDTQAKLAAQASVKAAEAAVENAQLNLGYTQVRSIISGIAGIAQVQVGNLVSPGTVLTGVSQVDPIKAYFPISGTEYLAIVNQAGGDTVDLLSHARHIPLELTLSNGATYPSSGQILFADRQVDAQTGTIQIVGAFPNPRRVLRPGQTGRIRAVTEIKKGALLVPQRAVSELQGGYEIAILGPNNKVHLQAVHVGPQVGSLWVITQGIHRGDRVVAEGADKVHDGASVTPKAYVPPASEN